jgi:hypothetical protein
MRLLLQAMVVCKTRNGYCLVSFELQSCQEWATCYTSNVSLASRTRGEVVGYPLSTISGKEVEPRANQRRLNLLTALCLLLAADT